MLDSFICILFHSDHKHPQNKIYEMKYSLDFLCEINSIVDTMGFHSRATPFNLIGKNRSSVNFIQPTQERHHHKQIFHKKRVACAGNNILPHAHEQKSMRSDQCINSILSCQISNWDWYQGCAPPRRVVRGKSLTHPHPAKGGFAPPHPILWFFPINICLTHKSVDLCTFSTRPAARF